jgi:DNA-binding NtrC family response regulator
VLSPKPVEEAAGKRTGSKGEPAGLLGNANVSLAALEKEHILKVLSACANNRTRAAEALEISIRTLRNKLHEYRLNHED